jgi:hypothetical protein
MTATTMENRKAIQDAMIDRIIDGMDTRDMYNFIGDILDEQFDGYTDEELLAEVTENYPDLLEEA